MMCEICGMEEGRIKYTKVINGEKVEFYICEKCAKKKGFLPLTKPSKKNIETVKKEKVPRNAECPLCGWKLYNVGKKGKLGCPQCYSTFRPYINTIVRELHGKGKHKGKVPVVDKRKLVLKRKIREVENALDDAVKKEEYELAAELRDEIKTLSLKIEENE